MVSEDARSASRAPFHSLSRFFASLREKFTDLEPDPEQINRLEPALVLLLHRAMFQSLPLAAILTFSDRVIYAGYSSLDDQALAGVIMWVPGSLPLLLPILGLIVELTSRRVAIGRNHA